MKKYNTPHRRRVIKTRLTEEEYSLLLPFPRSMMNCYLPLGNSQPSTGKSAAYPRDDYRISSLNPIAEADIYSKFNDIAGDKTAIYISHRLSSCKFCDIIVVFHEGAISQRLPRFSTVHLMYPRLTFHESS